MDVLNGLALGVVVDFTDVAIQNVGLGIGLVTGWTALYLGYATQEVSFSYILKVLAALILLDVILFFL